jgi:hypothetical protein
MALKSVASSSSVALSQKEATENMLRNVAKRSKSTNNLFAEAMKTYKEKEGEYQSTIEKMGEMIKNLQAANEALEKRDQERSLIQEGKMREIRRLASDLLEEGSAAEQTVSAACKQIIHDQDQNRLCRKVALCTKPPYNRITRLNVPHNPDPKEGFAGGRNYVPFLMSKIDPDNQKHVSSLDPGLPFEKATCFNVGKVEEEVKRLVEKIRRIERAIE